MDSDSSESSIGRYEGSSSRVPHPQRSHHRDRASTSHTTKPTLRRQISVDALQEQGYRKCIPYYTIAIPTLLALCIIFAMIAYFYIISQKPMPNEEIQDEKLKGSTNKSTKLTSTINPICLQPIQVGKCRAKISMFAFSRGEWRCVHFTYSGCDGNRNRFPTTEECEKHCY